MVRIEEIVEKVRRNHPQADLNLMRRAYLFSAREHKGQKRASGEAYLVHPLEVANILADMDETPRAKISTANAAILRVTVNICVSFAAQIGG